MKCKNEERARETRRITVVGNVIDYATMVFVILDKTARRRALL